jgi:hypothetical protein
LCDLHHTLRLGGWRILTRWFAGDAGPRRDLSRAKMLLTGAWQNPTWFDGRFYELEGIHSTLIAFVLTLLPVQVLAQAAEVGSIEDRIAIQEKLLYAYAYTYDAKDCVSWSNLFTTDAVLDLGRGASRGRDAIREECIARQKNVVGNINTRHNMMNIVFDQLTPRRAETRAYVILTWQKLGDQTIAVQQAFTYRDVIVKSDDGRWLFTERKAEGRGSPAN